MKRRTPAAAAARIIASGASTFWSRQFSKLS
jgi:hypothetical protein